MKSGTVTFSEIYCTAECHPITTQSLTFANFPGFTSQHFFHYHPMTATAHY